MAAALRCTATRAGESTKPRAMTHVARTLSVPAAAKNSSRRGAGAHQLAVDVVVLVMPRIAEIRQPRLVQPPCQCGREIRAVREARDLGKEPRPQLDEIRHVDRPQERLAAAGDDQARCAAILGEAIVTGHVEPPPIAGLVAQAADGRLREAKRTAQVARHAHRQHAARQEPTRIPARIAHASPKPAGESSSLRGRPASAAQKSPPLARQMVPRRT